MHAGMLNMQLVLLVCVLAECMQKNCKLLMSIQLMFLITVCQRLAISNTTLYLFWIDRGLVWHHAKSCTLQYVCKPSITSKARKA